MQNTAIPSVASAFIPAPEASALSAPPDPYGDINAYVDYQWRQAKQHRIAIDNELIKCLQQRRGEYSAEEQALISENIRTFLRATDVKCRAGKAFVMEVYDQTEGKFWELEPTPVAEVPDWLKDIAYKKLEQEMMAFGPGAMVDPAVIKERVGQMKKIMVEEIQSAALDATKRMDTKIKDIVVESNFRTAFDEFTNSLMTFPFAVFKGPYLTKQKRLNWQGNTLVERTEDVIEAKNVSPFDAYWTQGGNISSRGVFIEHMVMEIDELIAAKGMPNFSTEQIDLALAAYPSGYELDTNVRTRREQLEEQSPNVIRRDRMLDVINFWGKVPGDLLEKWGVKVADVANIYECNIWAVGQYVVRCVVNPTLTGRRPYYTTCYEKHPGSIIGDGVGQLMRPEQEMINSTVRAHRRNMGLASGPFAEVDQTRLADGQAPQEIVPAMVKLVEPDLTGGGRTAYNFHDINSHAGELFQVLEGWFRRADESTGIPAFTYTNQRLGGAGRTASGLDMLLKNATKQQKEVVRNIELDVLSGFIWQIWYYLMKNSPDMSIKADAKVTVYGLSRLLRKDEELQKRIQLAQVAQPFLASAQQQGLVKPEGYAVFVREMMEGTGFSIDKIIPDPAKYKEALGPAMPMGGPATGMPPGVPGMAGPPGAPPGLPQPGAGAPPGMPPPGAPPQQGMPPPGMMGAEPPTTAPAGM